MNKAFNALLVSYSIEVILTVMIAVTVGGGRVNTFVATPIFNGVLWGLITFWWKSDIQKWV